MILRFFEYLRVLLLNHLLLTHLSYSNPILRPYSNHFYLIDKLIHSISELLALFHNSFQAKQYVGMIQVRDLSIEILPKMYMDGIIMAV